MPKLLPTVMQKNNTESLGLTFSQMKKAARRMEKRCDGWLQEDAEAYVLQHSDPTGEHATEHADNPEECRFCGRTANEAAAARRLAVVA